MEWVGGFFASLCQDIVDNLEQVDVYKYKKQTQSNYHKTLKT